MQASASAMPLKFTAGITSGCCESPDILQTWLCSFSNSYRLVDEDVAVLWRGCDQKGYALLSGCMQQDMFVIDFFIGIKF